MTDQPGPSYQPHEDDVPPPTRPTKKSRKSPRSRRLLLAGLAVGLILVFAISGLILVINDNRGKLAEFDDAHDQLRTAQSAATDLLNEADPLEPEIATDLQGRIDHIGELLAEDPPTLMSFGIKDRTAALIASMDTLGEPTSTLEDAIESRDLYEASLSDAEDELSDAQEVLESTDGQVEDDDIHDQLSEHVAELEKVLNAESDETSGESLAAQAHGIAEASDNASASRGEVSDSHDAWVRAEEERKEEERRAEEERRRAEEEAAQTDPANYESISEREWSLVERDPDSREGEQYRLYGHVTQADAATGNISIRVDTGPVQQARRFDYDVNTFVVAGRDDVFSDVVQGDHVKMLAEVGGAFTYDTAIGGSATAVLVQAYDVEVIGHF